MDPSEATQRIAEDRPMTMRNPRESIIKRLRHRGKPTPDSRETMGMAPPFYRDDVISFMEDLLESNRDPEILALSTKLLAGKVRTLGYQVEDLKEQLKNAHRQMDQQADIVNDLRNLALLDSHKKSEPEETE